MWHVAPQSTSSLLWLFGVSVAAVVCKVVTNENQTFVFSGTDAATYVLFFFLKQKTLMWSSAWQWQFVKWGLERHSLMEWFSYQRRVANRLSLELRCFHCHILSTSWSTLNHVLSECNQTRFKLCERLQIVSFGLHNVESIAGSWSSF